MVPKCVASRSAPPTRGPLTARRRRPRSTPPRPRRTRYGYELVFDMAWSRVLRHTGCRRRVAEMADVNDAVVEGATPDVLQEPCRPRLLAGAICCQEFDKPNETP